MKPIDRRPVQKKYPGKWVAFDKDNVTVMGVGKTAKEALEKAKSKGVKIPILLSVPPVNAGLYIGRNRV